MQVVHAISSVFLVNDKNEIRTIEKEDEWFKVSCIFAVIFLSQVQKCRRISLFEWKLSFAGIHRILSLFYEKRYSANMVEK